MKHRIIFSYQDDESLPLLVSIPNHHKLKQKNIFMTDSSNTVNNGKHMIVHKRIGYGEDEIENQIGKKIDIFLTYTNDEGFLRGFLYINDKEYHVLDYKKYNSLQVENFCYDNIEVLRLPNYFYF